MKRCFCDINTLYSFNFIKILVILILMHYLLNLVWILSPSTEECTGNSLCSLVIRDCVINHDFRTNNRQKPVAKMTIILVPSHLLFPCKFNSSPRHPIHPLYLYLFILQLDPRPFDSMHSLVHIQVEGIIAQLQAPKIPHCGSSLDDENEWWWSIRGSIITRYLNYVESVYKVAIETCWWWKGPLMYRGE